MFREVDGRTVPIHLTGGCVGGYRGRGARHVARQVPARAVFDKPRSYLTPNAKCPVCRKDVFFFQSEHGGRVFFDAVGWPWPKHPCTDRLAKEPQKPVYSASSPRAYAATDWTRNYTFFSLVTLSREGEVLRLRLREITEGLGGFLRSLFSNTERTYTVRETELQTAGLKDADLRDAPNFLIKRTERLSERAEVQFICLRHKRVVRIGMKRLPEGQ